jgi:hypothetical protein
LQLLSKGYKTSVFSCVFWITTSHSLVSGHQHYRKAVDFSIRLAKLEDNNPDLISFLAVLYGRSDFEATLLLVICLA